MTSRPGRASSAARASLYRLIVVESQTATWPGAAPTRSRPTRSPARPGSSIQLPQDRTSPAPGCGLPTGAEKGRWLADFITTTWAELDRPCSERAVDYALACAARRVDAHDDERA